MGGIIVLAWPETIVHNAGAWYDIVMEVLGISKHGYYKVGHAAMVLVNFSNGELSYFDFGRYHTPRGTGRVRDKVTDPELTLKTAAVIKKGDLLNLEDILLELSHKKACHGSGKLVASFYTNICFRKAYENAKKLQKKGAISYGPFVINGTNCSRFVAKITRRSTLSRLKKLHLHFPYVLSSSPISNVKIANSFAYYYVVKESIMKKYSFISRVYNGAK